MINVTNILSQLSGKNKTVKSAFHGNRTVYAGGVTKHSLASPRVGERQGAIPVKNIYKSFLDIILKEHNNRMVMN